MATSIMTNNGRTQRTIDFFAKTNMYVGIGQETDWTAEPTPDIAIDTLEKINELVAIKKIETPKYVRIQTGGDILFNNNTWVEVSATEQTITASTISFVSATNTINDTGAGMPIFEVGTRIKVIGSTGDNYFIVVTSNASDLVVSDLTFDEAVGNSITIKSNLETNDINNIFYEAVFAYDNDSLPVGIDYRQIGLLEKPVELTTESLCTNNVYLAAGLSAVAEYPQGVLHYIDNRAPIYRTSSQREAIQFIVEF